ncbi:MAG: hypothetical protein AAB855_01850, partial [Patescibacteria group bacterium]
PNGVRNPVVAESVGIPRPAVAGVKPDAISGAVIDKSGVILSDEVRERVKKIIETRVRNVRNDIDTKNRLTSSSEEGGAGLAQEEAEKILGEVKNAMTMVAEGKEYTTHSDKNVIPSESEESRGTTGSLDKTEEMGSGTDFVAATKTEPDPTPKMVIKEVDGVPTIVEKPEKKGKGIPPVGRDDTQKTTEQTTEQNKESETQTALRGNDKNEPDPTPPPVTVPEHLKGAQEIPIAVSAQNKELEIKNQREERSDEKTGKTEEKTGSGTDLLRKTEPDPTKPDPKKISTPVGMTKGIVKKPIPDVKASPRLVGLTDELRALTIKDLRRMSENIAQSSQKIADKINSLAKESLSKRAEAINAWKESPAYQLYLEIGQLNLSQDMALLAEERKAAGKEYLTSDEFDALLDMNEKLRF